MRQHEVTKKQKLLTPTGALREPGWSRQLVQQYDRNDIKAAPFRIKEWDYYLVIGDGFGVAFTVSDLSYISMISASLLDFTTPSEITQTVIAPLPFGKLGLPPSSAEGNTVFKSKRLDIQFLVTPGERRIKCHFKNFKDKKPLECDILLKQPPMDTMVIATPWASDAKAFYYNQKINCMPASGYVKLDGKEYTFNESTDFGTLDWGRGVWTYDNTWYWGSGNGIVNGKPFGFNIGYGFGNNTAASENMLFYDGKCHKLDEVKFHIPPGDYMKKWRFSSSDGRFEMDFEPIIDRNAKIDIKLIVTDQHQVFGKMSGKAVLDDGEVLEIKDLLCFAEDVHNRY